MTALIELKHSLVAFEMVFRSERGEPAGLGLLDRGVRAIVLRHVDECRSVFRGRLGGALRNFCCDAEGDGGRLRLCGMGAFLQVIHKDPLVALHRRCPAFGKLDRGFYLRERLLVESDLARPCGRCGEEDQECGSHDVVFGGFWAFWKFGYFCRSSARAFSASKVLFSRW